MKERNRNNREYLKDFNPDVSELSNCEHQDLLYKFNAGSGYENFNDFISKEACKYAEDGEGVTYVVFNNIYDEQGQLSNTEVVAYYTLAATSIPYEDRIRYDEEEEKIYGKKYDVQICGIPAVEIKMFAVDVKYQDLFYVYEDEELPVSAWIIKKIIDSTENIMLHTLGFKALFLHSVPNAEAFYEENGFHPVEVNMQPLHSIDSDYKAMYLSLREVQMNYDD